MKSSELVNDFPISEIQGFFYERKVTDKDRLNELSKDIAQKGVLKNICIAKKLVRHKDKKPIGVNMVVAGFRTTKASIQAKRETVPARVYEVLTDLEATDILLSENIHFEDMNDFDIAQNLNRYVQAGIQQKAIAKRINRSEPYVSLYLSLLKDSEAIQKALVTNEVFTEKHARLVRPLPEKLHEKAISLVEGKTVKDAKEAIQKLSEENKAVVLKAEIKALQDSLKECDEAEKVKGEIERQVAELGGKMKALTPSSMDVKRLVAKIERIRVSYFPRKERLTQLKARKRELMKLKPEFDVKPIKKERDGVYTTLGKRQAKVKALKEQVSKIQTEIRKLKDEAKRLTEKIELVNTTKHELTRIDEEVKDLTTSLKELQNSLGKEIKDYDKLVKTVETSEKELLTQREAYFTQIGELKGKIRSLNGKIAQRTLREKRLADKRAELRNLKA